MHPSCQTLGVESSMASRISTSAANVATEGRNCLRSGQFQCRAWFCLVQARARLFLLSMSGGLFPRRHHCRRSDYVSARAEARANENVGQGHAGSAAFRRLGLVAAMLRLATVGYHASTVAPTPATPNPSIEGMPKRLRLLCTPHVKR